jgi:hypothetical protein
MPGVSMLGSYRLRMTRPTLSATLMAAFTALCVWLIALSTASADRELSGALPIDGGFTLAVWSGGTVDELTSVARTRQCDFVAAWAATADGALVGYVPGAPLVVNEPFFRRFPAGTIPSGAALIIGCRPLPGQPAVYPQAGSPSGIPVSAVVRGITASQLTVTTSLPGLPPVQQAVTGLRLCLRTPAGDRCQVEVAPPPEGRDYALPLPAVGEHAAVTVQLCNATGCGGYVHLAFVARAARFYAIAIDYGGSAQVFVRDVDSTVRTVRVTYSDGHAWTATCAAGTTACDSGSADATTGRTATVEAIAGDGALLAVAALPVRPG